MEKSNLLFKLLVRQFSQEVLNEIDRCLVILMVSKFVLSLNFISFIFIFYFKPNTSYILLHLYLSCQQMNVYTSISSLILGAPYLLLIPVYIVLSPLCIISSSLFDAALGITFDIDNQTTMLILILFSIWGISAIYIVQLIKNRTYKSIFFYEFVFYLSCFNFILIGITYTMLRRINLIEQVLAKTFSTLLLVYFAQKIKIKTDNLNQCRICFQQTIHDDCIILRCKHFFHEKCLWDWLYVKNKCPICCKAIKDQ